MDGLSAASGVIAVTSLALQLADSVNRLYDFIGSLKEAPKEIKSIQTSLSVVSSILDNIWHESSQTKQDAVVTAALFECEHYIGALNSIAEDFVPGFASAGPLARTWTAVKAVKKGDKIRKFQERLEQAKLTLVMAQQDHARRRQLEESSAQQKALLEVTHALENLQAQTSYQSEVISAYYTDREDYLEDVFREIRRVSSSWANPLVRSHLERKLREVVQSTLDSLSEKEDLAWSETGPELDETTEIPTRVLPYVQAPRPWKRINVARESSTLSTIFGQVHCSSQVYRVLRQGYGGPYDKAIGQQRKNYVVESSFWLVPSSWLAKCGMTYAVNVQIARSSHAGWNHVLKSFNLAPDTALIFDFCRSGNIDGVTTLFSKGLASIQDVNSEGSTPLHIAAANCHPQLCRLLIQEGADRSATKWVVWHQTPFSSAVYTRDQDYSFVRAQDKKEHRQIETFRVFLGAGEEIDDEDSSMDLQLSGFSDREIVKQGIGEGSDFVYPSLWLLERVLSSAQQTPGLYGYDWWVWRLRDAMLMTPNQKPFVEVLKYCSIPVVRSVMIHWIWLLSFPHRDYVKTIDFKRMYAKVRSLHFKAQRSYNTDEVEDVSPLGVAMEKSLSFSKFRAILKELDIDIEAFVTKEAEALDDGWTPETLMVLFRDNYQPIRHRDLSCDWCERNRLWTTLRHKEWLWDRRKERIKVGKDPEGPFSEDEVRVQEEWDAYVHRFVEERVCAQCQERGRSIRIRDISVTSVIKLGLTTPVKDSG